MKIELVDIQWVVPFLRNPRKNAALHRHRETDRGRLFDETSEPRAFNLTHSTVSPNGIITATYVRDDEVKTATIGGAQEPTPAELTRREKLKREG